MTTIIIDSKTLREYEIEYRHGGENAMECPVCSGDRRKKHAKPLSFNAGKGTANCNHCGSTFVEKGRGSDRVQEQKKEYVRPEWTNVTTLSDEVVKWFNRRGISQKTLVEAKISESFEWMPQVGDKRRVINFNYFRDGELINVKYRDGEKNFKLHKGAELIFYNLDAIKTQKEVVLVEGEIDCLTFIEAGIKNVVSVPNGASKGARLEYLDNCWQYFEDAETIYLAVDDDIPGRILRDELARRLGKEKCKIITFAGHKDANELWLSAPLEFQDCIQSALDYPIEGIYGLNSLKQRLFDLQKNGLKPGDGISISQFNELLTFVPGYTTLLTGIPSHGKSEFLDQIIIDLATLHGWPFGIFSPENHPIELHVSKFLSRAFCKPFNEATPTDMDLFVNQYNDFLFFISPPKDITLDSILDMARILVKKYGIKGLVLDPWNKLDHQYDGQETRYISQVLDKIDVFARLNDVHVFIVAHPSKMPKDKDTGVYEVPTPYSVSGSAHWFNKMANCISVYRHFYEDGSSSVTVHIQKVKFKHWGKQGQLSVNYDIDSGRYYVSGYKNTTSYVVAPEQVKMDMDSAGIKPNTSFTNPNRTIEPSYTPQHVEEWEK